LDLQRAEGARYAPVAVQPKRLALLAYLAVATPRGFHRRDVLIGLLWPQQDESHARCALRQALHALREALGKECLLTRGDEDVSLCSGRCGCDVYEFERALVDNALETAVAVYAGPFLNGFYLRGAPQFEHWLEAERDRFARRYAGAVETLAERAAGSGELWRAVEWWRRLAEHDPYNARIAVCLMEALERVGDRAGAIRHAERHAAFLRDELEAEPSPEVLVLAERLRKHPQSAEPPPHTGHEHRPLE
jgi:DNA-binding SARP family transcriptional activator